MIRHFLTLNLALMLQVLCSNISWAQFVLVSSPNEKVSVEATPFVMGFTKENILSMDGDPNGTVCGKNHLQGDFSNRWCHGLFVKITSDYLREKGASRLVAGILGGLIFVPKEYFFDENPSKSDLIIAEYPLFTGKESGQFSISLFGDGMTILSWKKYF